MRSFLVLLTLVICLVEWECAASTEKEGHSEHNTEQKKDAGSVNTTTAADQSQPEPHSQPQPLPQLQSDHIEGSEGSQQHHAPPKAPAVPKPSTGGPENHKDHDKNDPDNHDNNKGPKPDDAHLNNPPTAQSQPGHLSADQQQQQQQHASQSSTSHDKAERQEDTGVDLENKPDEIPASTPEDVTQTEQVGKQQKHTDSNTEHQDPLAASQTHAAPPSTPSHSTGSGVQQTPQRQPTTTINTDNTLGKDGDSERARTENNSKDHNAAQGTQLSSTGGKQDLPDTNKTPMTTAEETPIPADKPAIVPHSAADGAVHQTSTTTENKKPNQMQTSVTSSSQPVNGESISSANTSMNLSSAVKSFEKTDNSIVASSLFVLVALATLSLVAVAPAS